MYLHKDNRELFGDVLLLTSEKIGVAVDIVEKDYYVTMILKLLAKAKYTVVFKGGTSLSKAFGLIERFSEDIDITFTEHLGENRRKRLKYEILQPIAEELGMRIRNWNSIESDKDYNHYDYYYDSVYDNSMGGLPPFVKLETALMSYSFPTEEKQISNYIYEALGKEVRLHRQSMNENITPSARDEIDILEVVAKICDEDFYKSDYADTTIRLISDEVEYEVVKNFYRDFTKELFANA